MSSANATILEHVSSFGFEAALAQLTTAIEDAGLTVFARIDHAAGARQAGLAMPPTVVLTYGHAKGGTPIMLAAPQAALDLPLRVLVREEVDCARKSTGAPSCPSIRSRRRCWRPAFPTPSRLGWRRHKTS